MGLEKCPVLKDMVLQFGLVHEVNYDFVML